MATQYFDTGNTSTGVYYTANGNGTYTYNDMYGRTIDNIPQTGLPTSVLSQVNSGGGTTGPAPSTVPLQNDYVDASGVVHNASGGNTVATSPTSGTSVGTQSSTLVTPTKTLVTSPDKNTATQVFNAGTSTPGGYTGAYGTPNNNTTAPTHPPVTTNEQDAAAAAQRNGTTTTPQTQGTPTMPWAPGHTGSDVKALQDMLVSKGFMTQAEQNTGPGIFGPKTQAALAKYQMQNGTASPSGGASDGGQSSYTNQPATATQPAKSAVQSVIDDYTTAYNSLGLGDIKSEYQKFVQDQTDLTNKQNDEKSAIDNNPWMTQGVKDNTKAQIDKKYETRQNTLTHQIDLLDSLYKQGQLEVNNIITKAEAIDAAQAKEAADLAQRQVDAATELRKEAKQDKQFNETLAIQKQNADTSRINANKSGSGGGTVTERQQAALDAYGQVFAPNKKLPDGTPVLDSNGLVTPVAWKALINDYQGTRADFIKKYGNNIYTTTDSNGNVKVPSSYGLTPAEVKLIT